jgi:fluoride exporter
MLLWVVIAGGLGSGARYLIALAMAGATFPYGTLIVNLAGSFLLGFATQLSFGGIISAEARTVIGAGLLGGFTTYSSFNQETLMMLTGGAVGAAVLNVAVTVAGGLAAGALGLTAGRILTT